jgi:hypothetical protein
LFNEIKKGKCPFELSHLARIFPCGAIFVDANQTTKQKNNKISMKKLQKVTKNNSDGR